VRAPVAQPSKSTIALVTALLLVSPGARAAAVESIVEKYGLSGTWAPDCAKPASLQNPHVVYRLSDPDRLQREIMTAPDKVYEASIALSVVEIVPGELRMAWENGGGIVTNRVRARPGQMHVIDSIRDNGEKLYANGRRVRDFAAAPLFNKCPGMVFLPGAGHPPAVLIGPRIITASENRTLTAKTTA